MIIFLPPRKDLVRVEATVIEKTESWPKINMKFRKRKNYKRKKGKLEKAWQVSCPHPAPSDGPAAIGGLGPLGCTSHRHGGESSAPVLRCGGADGGPS